MSQLFSGKDITSAHNFNTILIINYLELTGARTKFANQNVGTCLWHVFAANRKLQRITQHAEGMSLRYGVIVLRNLTHPPTKKSFDH